MWWFVLFACTESEVRAPAFRSVLLAPPPATSAWHEDRFLTQLRTVDVLLVFDDSGSMEDDQQLLFEGIPSLLDALVAQPIDFHIGVVTTSVGSRQGRLRSVRGRSFVSDDDNRPLLLLLDLIHVGTLGSQFEQQFLAAYTAVENEEGFPENAAFYREEADLSILFVTDESENSGFSVLSLTDMIAWFAERKPHLTANAIAPVSSCRDSLSDVWIFQMAADASGGKIYDICDDWNANLEDLGFRIGAPTRELALSSLPLLDPWTLTVELNEPAEGGTAVRALSTCWAGEEQDDCEAAYLPGKNMVILQESPEPGSELVVRYQTRRDDQPGR